MADALKNNPLLEERERLMMLFEQAGNTQQPKKVSRFEGMSKEEKNEAVKKL